MQCQSQSAPFSVITAGKMRRAAKTNEESEQDFIFTNHRSIIWLIKDIRLIYCSMRVEENLIITDNYVVFTVMIAFVKEMWIKIARIRTDSS